MDSPRRHNLIDQVLIQFDQALRTCVPGATQGNRPSPAVQVDQAGNQSEAGDHQFSEQDRKHVAGLMRINHTGEVCAQALYLGQGLVSSFHFSSRVISLIVSRWHFLILNLSLSLFASLVRLRLTVSLSDG